MSESSPGDYGHLIKSVCEVASVGLCGVWEVHKIAAAGTLPDGEGVDNFTSSFEMIFSGSRGSKPAPLNPDLTLSGVKTFENAAWKAIKNSAFVTCFTCAFINPSISRPYAHFNGPMDQNTQRQVAEVDVTNAEA